MIEDKQYERLLIREAEHWGKVREDPQNPQIWHDPGLFETFFGKEYKHLIDRVAANRSRVLELGCGEGNLAIELAQRGLAVTGIDLSPERIQRAEIKAAHLLSSNIPTFVAADLNTIRLSTESLDCVVAHDSLHHILALDHLLGEVQKALKPGGRFIVMDFVGMGILRKLLAGALFALLPTYQPYAMKWKFRKRLPPFLADEEKKKASLAAGTDAALHEESPFEEISQASIVSEIEKKFKIVELFFFNPFWYYLAPKIRTPRTWRYPMARFFRRLDQMIVQLHLTRGAYFFLEATKA